LLNILEIIKASFCESGLEKAQIIIVFMRHDNNLRFELEMKKTILQDFLFMDHPKNFEDTLTRHFYEHSKKILVLDDLYSN